MPIVHLFISSPRGGLQEGRGRRQGGVLGELQLVPRQVLPPRWRVPSGGSCCLEEYGATTPRVVLQSNTRHWPGPRGHLPALVSFFAFFFAFTSVPRRLGGPDCRAYEADLRAAGVYADIVGVDGGTICSDKWS